MRARLSRYNWPVILSLSDICGTKQLHKSNLMISRPSFAAGNERRKSRAAVPPKPQNRLFFCAYARDIQRRQRRNRGGDRVRSLKISLLPRGDRMDRVLGPVPRLG